MIIANLHRNRAAAWLLSRRYALDLLSVPIYIRILILDLRSQYPYEQAKPEVSPMDILILPAHSMGYV